MPRPTFTASDVARYVFCNVAWAIEQRGDALAPEAVARELTRLDARGAQRTAEEEQEHRFLLQVRETFRKRDAGERYHADVHRAATTHPERTRRVFTLALLVALALAALVAWLLLRP